MRTYTVKCQQKKQSFDYLKIFVLALIFLINYKGYSQTGNDVWNDYVKNPFDHPNIPNNSYAGYHGGEASIPTVPVVVNLADYGGVGDGATDNTLAFQKAIRAAWEKGGGAVYVNAGIYQVNKLIHLNKDGVVIRGAGKDQTTIKFINGLDQASQPLNNNDGSTNWFWQGGLMWVSHESSLNKDFTVNQTYGNCTSIDLGSWWPEGCQEYGNFGTPIASVSNTPLKGSFTVEVNDATKLKAGQYYLLSWKNDAQNGDYDFVKHVVSNSLMQTFDWKSATDFNNITHFPWPVKIKSVSGTTVTLAQPLRLDIRTKWGVKFLNTGPIIYESGVENLTIEVVGALNQPNDHSHDVRHNAMFLTRAINCWVNNVDIKNANNGILTRATKNLSITNFNIIGNVRLHHGTTSVRSHDCMFSDFTMTPRISHGISTEEFSSGTVWRNGQQGKNTTDGGGSFDSHRFSSFDQIRTNLYCLNTIGRPGGKDGGGPLLGKRVVHWNIDGNTGDNKGLYVNQPDMHTSGALVGVRGIKNTECSWAMVCGDKGNIISDDGKVPAIADLYLKEFELRNQSDSYVSLVLPNYDFAKSGHTVTLKAAGNAGGSSVTSFTFNVNGTDVATVSSAPYQFDWKPAPGQYDILVKMVNGSGTTITSVSRKIIVGDRLRVDDTDSKIVYNGSFTSESCSDCYNGTNHYSGQDGAYFEYSFKGTYLAYFIKNVQSDEQRCKIYLDDMTNPVATFAPIPRQNGIEYKVWESGALNDATHKLRVVQNGNDVTLDFLEVISTGAAGGVNAPPSVSITSPVTNTTFAVGSTINIQASAGDSDGSVTKVEFFNGTTKLGEDTGSPYAYALTNAVAGNYSLTAKATDDKGVSFTSSVVTITVSSDSILRTPENPANTTAGLNYSYYEGSWNNLPDFTSLTPVKTGTSTNFDISLRNKEDNFAFKFTGYIDIPADGQYTFYTSSDDGSKLLIGSTEVVNNDGLHAEQEKSGKIGLKKGKHAITVTFFELGGGQGLSVSYEGPSVTKQAVPVSALFRASAIATVVYAINAGGVAYTAVDGAKYEADKYFTGGTPYTSSTTAIAGTDDDVLYTSERYGNFSYALPVANGTYDITFKFSENYWTAAGQRALNVSVEGTQVITNLDIYSSSGAGFKAYDIVKTATVSDGTLNINFVTVTDNAKISAILVKTSTSSASRQSPEIASSGLAPSKLNIYPNPTSGLIQIETPDVKSVEIFNIQGRRVLAVTNGESKIDLSNLSPGVYTIKIHTADKVYIQKIIRNN